MNPRRLLFTGAALHLPFLFRAASKGDCSLVLCLCLPCIHVSPSKEAPAVPPAILPRGHAYSWARSCGVFYTLKGVLLILASKPVEVRCPASFSPTPDGCLRALPQLQARVTLQAVFSRGLINVELLSLALSCSRSFVLRIGPPDARCVLVSHPVSTSEAVSPHCGL